MSVLNWLANILPSKDNPVSDSDIPSEGVNIQSDLEAKLETSSTMNDPEQETNKRGIGVTQSANTQNMVKTDLFSQFKTTLRSLWEQYGVSDELDFNTTAQKLFDEDMDVFVTLEDYILPDNFENFKKDLKTNEKLKEIAKFKGNYRQDKIDRVFIEFKSEVIELLQSENVLASKINQENLVLELFDNPANISETLNKHLKSVIIPKKIKSLISKIESSEKLKASWNSRSSSNSNNTFKNTVKNILIKHNFTGDKINTIVEELYSNFTNGLHLLEDECTPVDFDRIRSDLMNNNEVQSKANNSTVVQCQSSNEKTNKEIVKLELDKIWKDNAFKTLDNSLYNQFIEDLIDKGIDQAMQIIMPYMIRKHQPILIAVINNNQKIQNVILKPNVDDEQFKNIELLQKIMLGKNDNYSKDLFSKIIPLDFERFQDIIEQKINNDNNESLIDVMMPFIINKLKKGIDLSGLCASQIFWDDTKPVYGTDYKTILVCMTERYQNHQISSISLFTKLGIALPFAYNWIVDKKLISKIPLRAYSHCLAIDCPIIVSLGSNSIGKSTLLNKIFDTKFITNKVGKINGGIDVIFSSSEFSCGFTIFDIHGHVLQQENLIKVFCSMLPSKNCWILLQSTSIHEISTMFKMLRSFNFSDQQIICILRDCKRLSSEQTKQLQNGIQHSLSICKIEHDNPEFNANLVTFRKQLFTLTGIGKKGAKLPNNAQLREEDYNVYIEIENKIREQQYNNIYIATQDTETRDCTIHIDGLLKNIDRNMKDLQLFLFKHIYQNNKIQGERRKKSELIGKDTTERTTKLGKIDEEINKLSSAKASIIPSDLVRQYNKLFIEQKFNLMVEMDKRVYAWQSPILLPLFKQRNEILDQLKILQSTTQDLKTKNNNPNELKMNENLMKQFEEKKIENSVLIDKKTINKDFFMRELLSIYGDADFLTNQSEIIAFNKDAYIKSFVEYISEGNEIEIIDGDNNEFNTKIVADIFRGVEVKLGETEAPYVVSVIGPQSTGKSTLLNMLFGSNFQMSAGRCTKGLYASLFKTDYPNAKTLMVLDTEGLMSIEKANEEYDKKLTVFSMACSQIMLINLNGEINAAMKKILTISLFAANQLKILRIRPVIIFVLRNMMDLNVDKQKEMVDNVKKELKEVSELSELDLTQVLDFKEEKAFFLMLTAFNKDSVYNKDEELFQKSTTNAKFAELIQDLRKIVFDEANIISKNGKNFKSLSDWVKHATELWATLHLFNNILMIESIKEINERKELGEIITRIMKKFIEPNGEKSSFRSKLDEILIKQESNVSATNNIDIIVEQQFDEQESIFKEKVTNEFSAETENRSFENKLIKEYRERLEYAIRSSKTQAIEKYKAISQQRKIQNKIEFALTNLQLSSETKILEWQKVTKDVSTAEVARKKRELTDWFTNEMNETKQKIKHDLDTNKKTPEEWRNFVKNQIISATGTIPVEKVFYSINTLHQKAAEMSSSYHNIITLIDSTHSPIQNDIIIKKIPTLINNRKKKARLNRQNSNTAPAIPSGPIRERLYFQKSENKLVAKWKQFTSWISDTFVFPKGENKIRSETHQNNLSTQPTDQELTELYDICIDSDALVLIYSMFYEMSDYLKSVIGKEIFERTEYEIICLKQHLLQIQGKMSEISQKYLNDDDLEFTVNFGTELIEWLYDTILKKMTENEMKTYENLKQKADERISKLLKEFQSRLEKAFGDVENAECMAVKLFDNIKNGCVIKIEKEYKQELKLKTRLHSSELVSKSDEVFYGANGTYNTNDIFDYMTKMMEYMKKVYMKFFDAENNTMKSKCDENYSRNVQRESNILIENLRSLENIFGDFTTTQEPGVDNSDYVRNFFKRYLEGKNTYEELKQLNEKCSVQLTYSHPKNLDNPDILFKNISIFPIAKPRVFFRALTNKIQSLLENERKNGIFKFTLTNETMRERDQIKDLNLQEALGCIEQCPFCGCKCEEGVGRHDVHQSKKHRLMAFNGSYEMLSSGRKGFVFDLCNSEYTIRHGKWKENSSTQLSVRENKEIRERMSQYAVGQGDVTITLAWKDSNDLDLHVKCPCGTELFFGHTRCSSCSGYLDRDMNVCCCNGTCPNNKCSPTKPIENVFFKPAKSGLYTVSVHYYSGPKGNAGPRSNYEVRVSTHSNINVQTFNGYVESSGPKKIAEVGQYEHSSGLNFLEHVKRNFPAWRNISIVDDKRWENVLKKAWYQVAARMSQFHGFENNTPPGFANLNIS